MNEQGGVALVTGASTGFGRLIALALASRGYQVVGAFRGSRGGFDSQSTALRDAAQIDTVRIDVSSDDSVSRGVATVLERHGRIDVLVNCAGYGLLGPFESTTVEQARQVYETNVFGTMRVCAAVVPAMREQGSGFIVNVGSDVGVRANFFQSAYASSKAAVEGFTQVLRLELRPFGIRVAVLSPGWYSTEFGESVVATFESGAAAAVYAPLIAAWNQGVDRVEGPNDRPQEVADALIGLLATEEPPFRTPVGWNPVRMAGVSPDEIDVFQQRLLDYYGLLPTAV